MGPLFRKFFRDRFSSNRLSSSSNNNKSNNKPGSNPIAASWRASSKGHHKSEHSQSGGGGGVGGFSKLDAESKSGGGFQPYHPHGNAHTSEIAGGNPSRNLEADRMQMGGIQVKSDVEWSSVDKQ